MWRAGGAAIVAAMCMWCGVAGAATVITDPAGDANGLGNAGLDVATAPLSNDALDLTKVTISSDDTALTVAFTSTAPLTPGQVGSHFRLKLTTPQCPVSLLVAVSRATAGPPSSAAVSDSFDCPGFLALGGYSLTQSGSTWTARFPYDALKRNHVPITAGTALTHVSAESQLNDGVVYLDSFCGSTDPHGCDLDDLVYSKIRSRYYIGAVVDKTAEATIGRRKR